MSDTWTEAEFIDPNSPWGREMGWQHLEGFTRHRIAEARKKREQEKQAQEQQRQADLALAQAIAGKQALPGE